ncbi:Immediate early response 3-interacting protein 1 [Fasciola gigantica]|uniref:Immediate early response 3-interacting protein 1 n=2 Tax=Fasciola TaxID=6191 RepID=A0A4E0QYY5_FASHE|nr:Immediate early response 3-interacting protein 1 [Fasciola hepatica]TPP39683.1 Immediate early response 3-interacting protein 1 [Fasciola gigantica]
MAFGLFSLVEAIVLVLNAVCILHERRFLSKIGWAREDKEFSAPSTVKSQFLNIIHSIRTVMRIPLIGVNLIMMVFKLVAG